MTDKLVSLVAVLGMITVTLLAAAILLGLFVGESAGWVPLKGAVMFLALMMMAFVASVVSSFLEK